MPEFVQAGVVLAAGDGQLNPPPQFRQLVEGETGQGFLQPGATERLQGPGSLDSAAKIPAHTGLPAGGRLRLVGVHHDLHVVADGFPHGLDGTQVFPHRFVVQPNLQRPPAGPLQVRRLLRPLLGSGKPHQAGIRHHPDAPAAPELVQRLAAELADYVPQRDVHAGRALVGQAVGVVSEDGVVPLNVKWVLAHQLFPDRGQQGATPQPGPTPTSPPSTCTSTYEPPPMRSGQVPPGSHAGSTAPTSRSVRRRINRTPVIRTSDLSCIA